MYTDPIVDEVRSARERIAKESDNDIDIIIDRIQKSEAALESEGWTLSSPNHIIIK